MSEAPLMPKATAVWLVENTSLTFDQIAEFCKLHPLEVKGIADGEVATGIKGHDPIASGQLTREEIAAGEKNHERRLALAVAKVRLPEFKKPRGARYTPLSRRQEIPAQRDSLAGAQSSGVEGCADHAPCRHDQVDAGRGARSPPLELGQSAADGPGDPRPLRARDRPPRFRGVNRAAKERPKVEEDRGQTLVPAEITTAKPISDHPGRRIRRSQRAQAEGREDRRRFGVRQAQGAQERRLRQRAGPARRRTPAGRDRPPARTGCRIFLK